MNILLLLTISLTVIEYAASQSSCSNCQPLSRCPQIYNQNSRSSTCQLSNGKTGLCCPTIRASNSQSGFIKSRSGQEQRNLKLPPGWSDSVIEEKLSEIAANDLRLAKRTGKPSSSGHGLFNKLREEDKKDAEIARRLAKLNADNAIATRQATGNGVDSENSNVIRKLCPYNNERRPQCNFFSQFREADGSCNNKREPLLGMSNTPLARIAPAEYADADFQPRVAKSGLDLPSARLIRTQLLDGADRKDTNGISTFFVQMGQFIDHDISLSPEEEGECCEEDRNGRLWIFPSEFDRDRCAPIRIPDNDPLWGPKGRTCFNFRRSTAAFAIPNCQSTVLDQTNALTAWLDASNVYGSTEKELKYVREERSPLLRIKTGGTSRGGRSLLPACIEVASSREEVTGCTEVCSQRSRDCLAAGEQRVNEQPALATMHTIWLREHNRLVTALEDINPSWDTERLFQEARRILTAQWQHIIYGEWLPILLGLQYMTSFNLLPLTSGFTSNYDENLDPRVNNEFSTAAFRFGHSMMPRRFPSVDRTFKDRTQFNLDDVFFNSSLFREDPDMVENTVRGQIKEPAQAWDSGFNSDFTSRLFEDELDLISLNIQRGREHGLPGYNTYRDICESGSYRRASTFDQLTSGGFISSSNVRKLRQAYEDVDDIDLWTGALLENPHQDSLVGPAFKCILGDQFIRLKEGDRFWYETNDRVTGFTSQQLDAIRQASMARILCDNTDIGQITPLVFRTESSINRITPCSDLISIPILDLEPWREN